MGAGSTSPAWISQAIALIESDIRKHYTIRQIAKKVGTNSYALKRGFKEAHGQGLYEYLLKVRLKKAYDLLSQTDLPVKTIARQLGYKSSSSFVSMFKKKTGISPEQWRNGEKRK